MKQVELSAERAVGRVEGGIGDDSKVGAVVRCFDRTDRAELSNRVRERIKLAIGSAMPMAQSRARGLRQDRR